MIVKNKIFVFVCSLIAVLMFALCVINIQPAYAEQSNGAMEPREAEEEHHCWTSWEDDCIDDCLNHLVYKKKVYLYHGDRHGISPVTRIVDGFDEVRLDDNGGSGTFAFDIKGYFGNCSDCLYREPNVQFFYNTQTKEMLILAFGPSKHDYDIISYNLFASTIFQDELEFDNGKLCIANEVTTLRLGTKIREIGTRSFNSLLMLNNVDIINQNYSQSRLQKICFDAFNWASTGSSIPGRGIDMPVLHAGDSESYIKNKSDWGRCIDFNFNGVLYRGKHWDKPLTGKYLTAVENFEKTLCDKILPEEEADKDSKDVYHVVGGFNNIKVPIGDKETTISYDIRGYFGYNPTTLTREPHIQFFYNTSSKELNVVGFNDELMMTTYKYNVLFTSKTIFNDTLKFKSGFKYIISDNAKQIFVDTKVDTLGDLAFQHFKHLELVDIKNKEYNKAAFCIIDFHAFYDCSEFVDNGLDVEILHASKVDENYYLNKDKLWHSDTKVFLNGKTNVNPVQGLTYKYEESQVGIPNVEGVILSNAEDPNYNTATITNRGAEGTNAGIYKVKASLKTGHCWEDYSTNDRFYEFRIEGRKFDIKPIRLVYNSTFQVAYKANLFCKFENVPCEIGYLDPLITQRGVEGLSVGKYKVRAVPNPAFTWEDGSGIGKVVEFHITITDKTSIKEPAQGLVYNGKSQLGVESNVGFALTNEPLEGYSKANITENGAEALHAGKYAIRATLFQGWSWEDGTRDDKILKFEIAKAHPRFNCPKDPIKLNVYDCYCADIETVDLSTDIKVEKHGDCGLVITNQDDSEPGHFKLNMSTYAPGTYTIILKIDATNDTDGAEGSFTIVVH
ncbi:MAG: hypothetical protein Q4E88_02350 [Coriobacteriia bacterium]|nr:hypothetical protein [Coriobacteriia bacterium]